MNPSVYGGDYINWTRSKLKQPAHKTEGINRTITVRFYPSFSTGNAPRKGRRIPLNKIKNNEQRDEETGYGYFGARYMDHELMTMWLSVDPMADKYPSISPYAYCAWNPVRLIDPDGREWDLSALIEEQQAKFNQAMNHACDASALFKEIFCTLTNSKVVYKPRIGETHGDDIPAEYNSEDNTITYASEDKILSSSAYVEEFTHAYQLTENANLYNASLDFNYEFEAKVIKTLIQFELARYSRIEGEEGMQDLLQNFYDYGSKLTYLTATTSFFADTYKKNANSYANYNIANGIGNIHYQKATNQVPASLNLLLLKARPGSVYQK